MTASAAVGKQLMIRSFAKKLSSMQRSAKRAILIAYDLVAMCLALWAAFATRLGEMYFPENLAVFGAAVGSFAVGISALYRLQVYRLVVRYFEMRAVARIFAASALAAVAWVIFVYLTRASILVGGLTIDVPRSVAFIYCGFLFFLLFIGRYLMALVMAGAVGRSSQGHKGDVVKIAIYGANGAGISLAESMRGNRAYSLVAFIDDDNAVHGQMISGIPIYSPAALPELARSSELDEIFLAMPRATRAQRLTAISRLTQLNLKVKTVPAPEEIVSGRFTVSDVRAIVVNDLLRRDPVEPLTGLIRQAAEGHSILITGAGGSIGSEICRQLVHARPQRLVLLDHSEFALYSIDQQLDEILYALPKGERPEVVPIIGSMLNEQLVREIIERHHVDTIYHAAAYKHVPLLEDNEVAGVENNVLGTLILARAALDLKLTQFTMISTDKAVRPESVMGASKRVAELIVQAFSERPENSTRFGIVRFGNVLDSSGSVVQRFRKQIARGGPVTVTHRDVTRFFMSIPEATQLVLQASAMAKGGEVFVLDMGEPIKISELAINMISLSGLTVRDEVNPQGDIEVVYVGLRPGEKLHEELFVGSQTVETTHPRISMARERFLPLDELTPYVDRLRAAITERNREQVRQELREMLEPDQSHQFNNVTSLMRA